MSIEPVSIPDIPFESLTETEKTLVNEFLFLIVEKINEIIAKVNTEHP